MSEVRRGRGSRGCVPGWSVSPCGVSAKLVMAALAAAAVVACSSSSTGSADATPEQLYQHGKNAKMFERTASRLDEMQSDDWLGLAHLA